MCCFALLQMEYERQVASVRAQNALEGDFSISQAEMSSRQAMLENASDIKVAHLESSQKIASNMFTEKCLKLCCWGVTILIQKLIAVNFAILMMENKNRSTIYPIYTVYIFF